MQRTLDMVIRHGLSREAAKQRLDDGLHHAMQEVAPYASHTDHEWRDYDLTFSVTALGATASGVASVQDDAVRIMAKLPLMLAPFSAKIRSFVEDSGQAFFDEAR